MLAAAVFGGCVVAESADTVAQTGDGPQIASGPASFDDTTGAVAGTITDQELQPIAGAIIGVLKSEVITEDYTVLSDAAGQFAFSLLPPGDHTVAGSALGFTSESKRVTVQAGAVSEVSLIVDRLAAETARQVTEIKKGTVTAYMYRATPGQCYYFSSTIPQTGNPSVDQYRTLVKSCGGSGSASFGQPHWIDEFLPETQWKTIVAELEWQPQSAVTGKGFLMDLNAPNITRGYGGSIDQASPYTWYKMQGKSPIIIRVDNPTTLVERGIPESDWYSYPEGEGCTAPPAGGNCDWFLRIFGAYCDVSSTFGDCFFSPVDVGLPQDLPITLYFSYFYMDPADPSFTALPDA